MMSYALKIIILDYMMMAHLNLGPIRLESNKNKRLHE